ATPTPELAAAQAAWENETRAALAAKKPAWVVQPPKQVKSQRGATLTAQPDASVLASGANPDKDVYTVTLTSDLPRLSGLRLEALRHRWLPGGGLSRANGNFVLTGVDVKVQAKDGPAQPVKLAKALADYEQAGYPVAHAIDDNPTSGWAVDGHTRPADRQAVF